MLSCGEVKSGLGYGETLAAIDGGRICKTKVYYSWTIQSLPRGLKLNEILALEWVWVLQRNRRACSNAP